MPFPRGLALPLVAGAALGVLSTYPYAATAIAYRHRDNGQAYLILVMGVGLWNGMFAAQTLSADPVVKGFFLALEAVGALLAGLGWFLFAGTASSTPAVPNRRSLYGLAAVLVGGAIALAMTNPAHGLYWAATTAAAPSGFAAVAPRLGYWLYTGLLAALFVGGAVLFGAAWRSGASVRYTRAYTVAGAATALAVLGGSLVAPGGLSVAPLVALAGSTVGWVQAGRGRVVRRLRSWGRALRRTG
ncbi:MAG: histidine kinase N-terminal 7TM domain-containing protein [Halobacteriales archaeon]